MFSARDFAAEAYPYLSTAHFDCKSDVNMEVEYTLRVSARRLKALEDRQRDEAQGPARAPSER